MPARPSRTAAATGLLGLLAPLLVGLAVPAATSTHTTAAAASSADAPVPDRTSGPVVATAFDEEPGSAAAGARGIRKWPRGRITYVDRTKDRDAVRAAVKLWNRSGVKIRFVKVRKASRAALVIRDSTNVPSGCGSGLASLGYVPGGRAFVNILHGGDEGGQGCAFPGQTLVVAHELGHVLGLRHDDSRCSVMNSSHVNGVAQRECLGEDLSATAKPGRWRCRVLERVDLKRAARMYGGRPKVRQQEWCDAIERIPATGPVTWTPDSYGGAGDLTVVRGAEPPVPGWLGTWGFGAPGLEVHATPGVCTAVPGDDATTVRTDLWEVPVGASQEVSLYGLAPGTHCVSVWQFDQGTNYALAPSTVTVTVS
ncbi:M57 family metalloprotease [Nocardioides solisilvae]|uniref:M57 family metalloprotease n=1 Tax=Nocardioides solisilvae TaxID=1542435 RepID=UPI0013A590BE|nr:M57 family metalloprotease [Nocardioides solisilvae]